MTRALAAAQARAGAPLAAGTAFLVLVVLASTAAAVAEPAAEESLHAAGEAAERHSFRGVLLMRWSEGTTKRAKSLLVEAAEGSVVVRGDTAAIASPRQRLVEHDGEWDLLWPVPQRGPDRPSPARKYRVQAVPGGTIDGRATRIVEFSYGGVLLERLHFDTATDLLLRREQFDGGPSPSRTIGFEKLTIGPADIAPGMPEKVVNATATSVTGKRLPSGVSAPEQLPDSYQRLGVFRRSDVTQVLYSDGLYDLSVFQQEGRLDRSDLPGGQKMQIGKRTGWHYVWPGGHLVVWEARGVVHTAISDAPLSQVMAAVTSIPLTGGSASLLRRLRQVCRALVQPLV
ncbi:MAG: hypothetical protein M3314_13825 [Actinomycetota bacterium]|nr:hypothetical protein [Actinomycetota bacterium]